MRGIKLLLRPFAYMTMIESFFMIVCLCCELYSGGKNVFAFAASACFALFFALMFLFASTGGSLRVVSGSAKVAVTIASWLICVPFGVLPYKLSVLGMTYPESIFEFLSALTTTSCTLFLRSPEVGIGLKLWHTFIAGIGGIGVVIIYFVFLSGGTELSNGLHSFAKKDFSNEYTSEPIIIRHLVKKVLLAYLAMILSCSCIYLLLRMPIVEAITVAIATVSTSGFIHSDNYLNIFNSNARMVTATIFMALGSMPLVLIFASIERRSVNILKIDQVFWFATIVLFVVLIIVAKNYSGQSLPSGSDFVQSLFYAMSSISTTGFGLGGIAVAKGSVMAMLLLLPIVGGCSGSTAGGLKVHRFVVFFKALGMEIGSKISPKTISYVKINGRNVDKSSIDSSILLFGAYFLTIFGFAILLSLLVEVDFSQAMLVIIAMITNSGLSDPSLFSASFGNIVDKNIILSISSAVMLIGRVELFAVYFLFSRRFWTS